MHGLSEPGCRTTRKTRRAESLAATPPVVLAAGRIDRLEVHFLAYILTNIRDPEIAGLGIKARTPRVAEPIRPDRRDRARVADERVVRRDRVILVRVRGERIGTIDIDAVKLAQGLQQIARSVAGVVR